MFLFCCRHLAAAAGNRPSVASKVPSPILTNVSSKSGGIWNAAANLNLLNDKNTWAGPWENVSYAICEQQRRRSACAPAQSDQRLCCSLRRQNDTSSLYIRNFKILVGLCSWAGQFVSCLVGDSRRHIFSWRGSCHITYFLPKNKIWNNLCVPVSLLLVHADSKTIFPVLE